MRKIETEQALLTIMECLNTFEMSDDLRERLFLLTGHLLADKKVLDARAERIKINRMGAQHEC